MIRLRWLLAALLLFVPFARANSLRDSPPPITAAMPLSLAQTTTSGGTAFSNTSGYGFQDVATIAAPANPATGYIRLYGDSGSGNFTCLTSAGASCVSAGGGSSAFPLTVSGTVTSGGIPYFNSTTQESSSGLLTLNLLIKGGGAGGAPVPSSLTDNGTTIAATEPISTTGSLTTGSGCTPAGATATGGICFTDSTTTGWTPTSAYSYIRASSVTNAFLCSLNGGAEVGCNPTIPASWATGNVISGGVWPLLADAGFLATNVVRKDTTNTAAAAINTPGTVELLQEEVYATGPVDPSLIDM